MEPELRERRIHRLPHRLARKATAVVALREEVAEMGLLEGGERDPAQLDPADQLVRLVDEDGEVDEIRGRAQPLDAPPLCLGPEECLGPRRLPRSENSRSRRSTSTSASASAASRRWREISLTRPKLDDRAKVVTLATLGRCRGSSASTTSR
jgi:hypothetical protein